MENGRQLVKINGHDYFADISKGVVYLDEEGDAGVRFDRLTKNEREQMENYLKYRKPAE